MNHEEPNHRPKLASKVRIQWDESEQKTMLLYPERGLLLNETAAAIAKLCDGSRTVPEIVRDLGFPGDRAKIEREVLGFVEQLRARNLLE